MSTIRVNTLQTTDSSFTIDVEDLAGFSNAADLADQANPLKGAALVGYDGGTVKEALDDLAAQNTNTTTVDNFGAVGNGVTSDIAAFNAMAAATGGIIRLGPKAYRVHGWSYSGEYLRIEGVGKPSYNDTYTTLQNGSILVGAFTVLAREIYVRDWGCDVGPARGFAPGQSGFTLNSPVGGIGRIMSAKNISLLGSDTAAASVAHGFLSEGFERGTVDNFDCAKLWYGLIWKGRRAEINNIRAYHIGGTPCFIKSDTPSFAGFVTDASVNGVIVNNVLNDCRPGNGESNGVAVMASTLLLANVTVTNVENNGGRSAVTVTGGVSPIYCVNVNISNVRAVGSVIGAELFGTTFDCSIDNISVDNPVTGQAWQTSGASSNWRVSNTTLIQTTGVAGSACTPNGDGLWNNFSFRSGVGAKNIPAHVGLVTPGLIHGPLTNV